MRCHTTSRPRRGAALILAVAILAVLAVLATSFVRMMSLEHEAAVNYVAVERSRAMAAGGLEHALGALRTRAQAQYWATANDRWTYRVSVGDRGYDVGAGLPLERAAEPISDVVTAVPSLYRGDTGRSDKGDPLLADRSAAETSEYSVYSADVARTRRGRRVSGWIGSSARREGPRAKFIAGTYEHWGDTFSLKVIDCSSQIDINMDTAYLADLLDDLGYEIDHYFRRRFDVSGKESALTKEELRGMGYRYPGVYFLERIGINRSGQTSGLGRWLLAHRSKRPGGVFTSKEELHGLISDAIGDGPHEVAGDVLSNHALTGEDYDKIKDFITLHAWRNTKVLEPGSLMTAEAYEAKGLPRKEARAPINLNTASAPVLTAWMRGIKYHKYDQGAFVGTFAIDRSGRGGPAGIRRVVQALRRVLHLAPLMEMAGLTALLRDGEFQAAGMHGDISAAGRAIDDFRTRIGAWDRWDRDAILAMADPNTVLNKFNPDALVRRDVDKYDLARWTTELCFNAMGYWEIYSLGAITHHGGNVIARTKLRAVYQISDQIVRTTQRDFEVDRLTWGVDPQTGDKVRLRDRGFSAVISHPENRQRFPEYKARGTGRGRFASADPQRYGHAALYDGSLSFNVMARVSLGKGDFAAGFAYPRGYNPGSGKSALDGSHPVGSGSMYQRMPGAFDSARSTRRGRRLRMVEGDSGRRRGGAAAAARFTTGSDAFSMGFYADSVRRRALAYSAPVAMSGGPAGSVQFWVKPRWHASKGRDAWWSWEDADGESIEIFRKGTSVVAQFSLGFGAEGQLRYDADHWEAGTWHFIHVDWGTDGRMFVDGEEATSGGHKSATDEDAEPEASEHPRARHMHFGAWPPNTAKQMQVYEVYPDKYRSAIEWVENNVEPEERRYTDSGPRDVWVGYSKDASGESWANATIDNVVMRRSRVYGPGVEAQTKGLDLPFRFYPKTYHDAPNLYWQDLTAAFAQYGSELQLASIAPTVVHGGSSFARIMLQLGERPVDELPG